MSTFPSSPRTRNESFADGLTVRVDEYGSGRPILVLHSGGGPQTVAGLAAALSRRAHVLVPTHPGFAGEPRPEWFDSIDDLALAYLDLLDWLDLHDARDMAPMSISPCPRSLPIHMNLEQAPSGHSSGDEFADEEASQGRRRGDADRLQNGHQHVATPDDAATNAEQYEQDRRSDDRDDARRSKRQKCERNDRDGQIRPLSGIIDHWRPFRSEL